MRVGLFELPLMREGANREPPAHQGYARAQPRERADEAGEGRGAWSVEDAVGWVIVTKSLGVVKMFSRIICRSFLNRSFRLQKYLSLGRVLINDFIYFVTYPLTN